MIDRVIKFSVIVIRRSHAAPLHHLLRQVVLFILDARIKRRSDGEIHVFARPEEEGNVVQAQIPDSIHFYIFQRILLVSVIAVVVGIEHERRVVELAALLQLVQQPVHPHVEIHQPRLIALVAQIYVRRDFLSRSLVRLRLFGIERKFFVDITARGGITVDALVVHFKILDGTLLRKRGFLLLRPVRRIVAVQDKVVVRAVADERHHLRIEQIALPVRISKLVRILRDHLAVAVEIVETVLLVIPVQKRAGIQKMRVFKSVQPRPEREIAVVIRADVRMEVVRRIAVRLHDARERERESVVQKVVDGIPVLGGIAPEDGHRLGMVRLVARRIVDHRDALIRQRVERGRIGRVDAVPLARLDDDEHDILPVEHARHDLIAAAVRGKVEVFQRRARLPARKIFVQRGNALGGVLLCQVALLYVRYEIRYIFIVKAERAEGFERLRRNKLRRVEIVVVLVNIQRVAAVRTREGTLCRKIQAFGDPADEKRQEKRQNDRLPAARVFHPDPAADGDAIGDLRRQEQHERADQIEIQIVDIESARRLSRKIEHGEDKNIPAQVVQQFVDDGEQALQRQQSDDDRRLCNKRRDYVDERRNDQHARYIQKNVLGKGAEPHEEEGQHFHEKRRYQIAACKQQLFQQYSRHSSASAPLKNS